MKIKALSLFIIAQLISHSVISQNHDTIFNAISEYQNVRDFTLSKSGNEAYVTIQSPLGEVSVITQLIKSESGWNKPTLVHFTGKYKDLEPFLSIDNLRLFFVSNRPLDSTSTKPKDYDIWYVERQNIDSEWSKPINLGAPINTEHNEFYPSLSQNNNLYFTSDNPIAIGKDDIFYSEWKSGKYSNPIALSAAVNTEGYEFNAYIASDESFLIFSGYNRKDGLGNGDLYISKKDENNGWSTAVNLGENFNSKSIDYCPFVHEPSGILYFTSKRSRYNEVQNITTLKDLNTAINKIENGSSKIYALPINTVIQLQKN